ncbi:MAG: NAD(P)/FAD-dependent oxidoreductase [Ilumatobacteraceae bacterium]
MRVVVIGAGLAGLVAAGDLVRAGVEVVVVDKGRSPGGRLATRRIGGARLDHGAQFFTVRTPAFRARVEDWASRGLVRIWTNGFDGDDGHPRYIAVDGMTALAKDLAVGIDVRCSTMAFAVRAAESQATHRWDVVIDDASRQSADVVIVTCPLPQAFALLVDTGIDLDEGPFRTDYDRTIGLLAVLDGPSAVPAAGGVQVGDATFSFVADNFAKGVSEIPALTLHANPEWSEEHWSDDDQVLLERLEREAQPWLGTANIVERELKKWRFATPRQVVSDPCWRNDDGTIILAGDAFAGPRVEGAHNSGLAAAHAILD